MPQFTVTGPNGRQITITGDAMPSGDELDEIFAQAPAAPTTEEEGPGLFGRTLDVVGRVGQTLNRVTGGATLPLAADEILDTVRGKQTVGQGLSDFGSRVKDAYTPTGVGTWKTNPDFNQVLENQGVEEALKPLVGDKGADWATAGLGFVGDVFIDPLRVNAVNKGLGKAIGAVAKAPGQAVDAARATNVGAKILKPVDTLLDPVKKAFTPDYEVLRKFKAEDSPIDLADRVRLLNSELRHAGEESTEVAKKAFLSGEKKWHGGAKDIPLEKRAEFAYAIDKNAPVPKGMEDLSTQWKKTYDQVWREKQAMGTTTRLVEDAKGNLIPKELDKQDDYITYFTKGGRPVEAVVGPATNVMNRTDKARKFTSLEDAVANGNAIEDAREIMAASLTMHKKSQRTYGFMQELQRDFGSAVPKPGYKKFDRAHIGVPDKMWHLDGLKDQYFPEEIVDYVGRAVKLWEAPNELDNLWKTGTKLFKSVATSINFPHHATNFMGNLMNMNVAGKMDTPDIVRGLKQSYGVLGGRTPWPSVAIGKTKFTGEQIQELAKQYEIIGTASHLRDLTEAGTAEWLTNNAALSAGRRFGTNRIEEPARLALWLHNIQKKGMHPAEAAINVKNVMIDYAELTPFEQKIRDYAIPFYTWARKNPVIQAKSLVDNPRGIQNVTDLQNVAWNAEKDRVDESIIPEASAERGMLPSFLGNEGNTLSMMRFAAPQNDLNNFMRPMNFLADSLHPVPKAIMESVMNQKTNGAPVKTTSGFAAPSGLASLVSFVTPDAIENQIPPELQGYLNTVTVAGRPRQRDRAAWLTGMIPTGAYGSIPKSKLDDPLSPQMDNPYWIESILRLAGMTQDPLSGQDQDFEAQRRIKEFRRNQRMRQIVLEK